MGTFCGGWCLFGIVIGTFFRRFCRLECYWGRRKRFFLCVYRGDMVDRDRFFYVFFEWRFRFWVLEFEFAVVGFSGFLFCYFVRGGF